MTTMNRPAPASTMARVRLGEAPAFEGAAAGSERVEVVGWRRNPALSLSRRAPLPYLDSPVPNQNDSPLSECSERHALLL